MNKSCACYGNAVNFKKKKMKITRAVEEKGK